MPRAIHRCLQEELTAAAITGGVTSFLTTPLDLIKTKLMMQSTSAGGQYAGVWDALTSIYHEGAVTSWRYFMFPINHLNLSTHTLNLKTRLAPSHYN